MELLVPVDKYEVEANKVKSYLEKQMTLNTESGKTYRGWMLDLCLKHRPKRKSILDYAIKECCFGYEISLKMLLNAGVEIPESIKDYIDEYLSHRNGTAFIDGNEYRFCWPKNDPNDTLLTSGKTFMCNIPSKNRFNISARIAYYKTNEDLMDDARDKFCHAIEESENEKKLVVQNKTELPNDLVGLIFTYLNIIKWKNYHEIDKTQFNS